MYHAAAHPMRPARGAACATAAPDALPGLSTAPSHASASAGRSGRAKSGEESRACLTGARDAGARQPTDRASRARPGGGPRASGDLQGVHRMAGRRTGGRDRAGHRPDRRSRARHARRTAVSTLDPRGADPSRWARRGRAARHAAHPVGRHPATSLGAHAGRPTPTASRRVGTAVGGARGSGRRTGTAQRYFNRV